MNKPVMYWSGSMTIEQLFVFCQLDKQVTYGQCWKSYDALDMADLTSFESLKHVSYKMIESNLRESGYRFPAKTAEYLSRNVLSIDPQTLHKITREKLQKVAIGFGPKLASLFVAIRDDKESIAIIDVHIRRWMEEQGLELTGVYETDEKTFQEAAKVRGMSMRALDLEIWNARRRK